MDGSSDRTQDQTHSGAWSSARSIRHCTILHCAALDSQTRQRERRQSPGQSEHQGRQQTQSWHSLRQRPWATEAAPACAGRLTALAAWDRGGHLTWPRSPSDARLSSAVGARHLHFQGLPTPACLRPAPSNKQQTIFTTRPPARTITTASPRPRPHPHPHPQPPPHRPVGAAASSVRATPTLPASPPSSPSSSLPTTTTIPACQTLCAHHRNPQLPPPSHPIFTPSTSSTMAGGKGKSSGGKSSGGKTSGADGSKKQQSHSARAGLQVRNHSSL